MSATDFKPENWDGDGLPDDDDDVLELFRDLGMLPDEVTALYDLCKAHAWVYEHVARHREPEWNLAVSRYYWRRAERFRVLAKRYDEEECTP